VKVVLTTEALDDLERISDYIAQDNPPRARSFVQELMEKARQLGDLPRGFPLVPRYAHLGIRHRTHGSYLIFYRVEEDRITVIHFLHGSRDYETLLFPEG
jgi:addiction module RelE/StbE family toxin